MKIIISHDVDNLSVKDHLFKDWIILREISRSFSEFFRKKFPFSVLFRRLTEIFKRKAWSNLEELLKFDKENKINSTFFVAVAKGKVTNYSQRQAKQAIELIKKYGFDVGIHGICYNNYEKMKKEHEDFERISGLERFGMRMHYLKSDQETFENFAKLGYLYDTTVLSNNLEQKYKINGLIEIPFHIMDSRLLGYRSNSTLEEVKEKIVKLLERAEKENKEYFAALFHDRRFSNHFPDIKNLYIWLIDYCKERGYKFINYKDLL